MVPSMHDLTGELKRLVGWGASPKRLPLFPVLLRLAEAENASFTAQGYIVLDYLKTSIGQVDEPVPFGGREVEPAVARRCFLLLLGIEGTGLKAGHRRMRVIQLLRFYCSVEAWKKPIGPEREFLTILAKHMTERHGASPT